MLAKFDIGHEASRVTRTNRAVAEQVHQHSVGALAAQRAIQSVRDGADLDVVWLRLVETVTAHGFKSPATAAFVRELAKRLR